MAPLLGNYEKSTVMPSLIAIYELRKLCLSSVQLFKYLSSDQFIIYLLLFIYIYNYEYVTFSLDSVPLLLKSIIMLAYHNTSAGLPLGKSKLFSRFQVSYPIGEKHFVN